MCHHPIKTSPMKMLVIAAVCDYLKKIANFIVLFVKSYVIFVVFN